MAAHVMHGVESVVVIMVEASVAMDLHAFVLKSKGKSKYHRVDS